MIFVIKLDLYLILLLYLHIWFLRLLITWLHLLPQSALIQIYKDQSFPNASVLCGFCLLNRMLYFCLTRKLVSLMPLMLIINYLVFQDWNIITLEYFPFYPIVALSVCLAISTCQTKPTKIKSILSFQGWL